MRSWAALLGMACLLTGCAPAVLHGPRVLPGWGGGAAVGPGVGELGTPGEGLAPLRDQTEYLVLGRAGVRYAWGGDQHAAAWSVGWQTAAVGVAQEGVWLGELDVYHAFATEGIESGVGALLSPDLVAPYIQLGRTAGIEHGWYTTQAMLWTREDPELDRGRVLLWVPTLARTQVGPGEVVYHLLLTAAVGQVRSEALVPQGRGEPHRLVERVQAAWLFSLGAAVELP